MSDFARWFAGTWARMYTLGLPPEARGARQDEIASDTWEQLSDDDGASGAGVLARVLLGMPADVMWRLTATHAPAGLRTASRAWGDVVLVAVAIPAALFAVLIGMSIPFAGWDSLVSRLFWGGVFGATGVVLLVGLASWGRSPRRGAIITTLGAWLMLLAMFWMWFIWLPVALTVTWFSIRRARRLSASAS